MESKVVVITGASGGIGAAVARRLGADGHRLVLGARRSDELGRVAAEARERGAPDVRAVTVDVTRRADVLRLRDAALDAFGDFDVWINNAGRGITRRVLDLTDEDVDEMVTVNVKSALYGMQAAVPHFVARGSGHLINVSSTLARVPISPFRSAYSAAKAALSSLTTTLRLELRETSPNVHVSLVLPGVVTSDFARHVRGEPVAPVTGAARAQTPDEAAEAFAELIARPVPELHTNPHSAALARQFYDELHPPA